jgi:hypothetical protein
LRIKNETPKKHGQYEINTSSNEEISHFEAFRNLEARLRWLEANDLAIKRNWSPYNPYDFFNFIKKNEN